MEIVTWEFIALVMGVIITILSFVYKMLGNSSSVSKDQIELIKTTLEKEDAILLEKVNHLKNDVEDIKKLINKSDEKNRDFIVKVERNINQLTQLVFELANRGNN